MFLEFCKGIVGTVSVLDFVKSRYIVDRFECFIDLNVSENRVLYSFQESESVFCLDLSEWISMHWPFVEFVVLGFGIMYLDLNPVPEFQQLEFEIFV